MAAACGVLDAAAGFGAGDFACAHVNCRRTTCTADRSWTAVVAVEHLAIDGATLERARLGFARSTRGMCRRSPLPGQRGGVFRRWLKRWRRLDHDVALRLIASAGSILIGDRAARIDAANHRLRVQWHRGGKCEQGQRCKDGGTRIHGWRCRCRFVAVSGKLDRAAMVGSRARV